LETYKGVKKEPGIPTKKKKPKKTKPKKSDQDLLYSAAVNREIRGFITRRKGEKGGLPSSLNCSKTAPKQGVHAQKPTTCVFLATGERIHGGVKNKNWGRVLISVTNHVPNEKKITMGDRHLDVSNKAPVCNRM